MRALLLPLLLMCFLVASCVQPTYIPDKMHVPFFAKKGQVIASVGLSHAPELFGGYAFDHEWAAIASARLPNLENVNDSIFHDNYFFQAGGGWFYRNLGTFRFEAFGTVGYGSTKMQDEYDGGGFFNLFPSPTQKGTTEFDYMRYAIQANAGWAWQTFEMAFSVRYGYMVIGKQYVHKEFADDGTVIEDTHSGYPNAFTLDIGFLTRLKLAKEAGIEFQFGQGRMTQNLGFPGSNVVGFANIGFTYIF